MKEKISLNEKLRWLSEYLNPIDDIMFCKMAEDKEFCEEILRVILSDSKLKVIKATPQWTGKNLKGRSVILDAECVLGDGTLVDIEVQKADNDDHQKRVRYNGAILTTNTTETGAKFKNIPNVCIVFISTFDIFGKNRSLYHVDRVIRETGDTVWNGFEEVYVNAAVKDGSDVAELMRVFTEDNTYNNNFPKTSENKRLYKETEGGNKMMYTTFQEFIANEIAEAREEASTKARTEALSEGRAEGRNDANKETAKRLIAKQIMSLEEIADITSLPLNTVIKIQEAVLAK